MKRNGQFFSRPPRASLAVLIIAAFPASADPARLDQAIERAFAYFATHELRGDQAFFVTQSALILGADWPERAQSLSLEPGISHPVEVGLIDIRSQRLEIPDDSFDLSASDAQPFSPRLTENQVVDIFRFMHLAVSCQDQPDDQLAALSEWLLQPGSGYLVAHQLAALQIAEARGCVEGNPSEVRFGLARHIYRELLAQSNFNDLVAEQIAVLCMAGYGDQVPDRFFQMLLDEQQASGGWGLRNLDVAENVFFPEGHTAALALYGLACYQRRLAN